MTAILVLPNIIRDAIEPAFALLPPAMASDAAVVQLLSIGLQESRFEFRAQKIVGHPYMKGPARGYWQMERGGGVFGVMSHPATKDLAHQVCAARGVPFDSVLIHARLEDDDTLAAAFARLLLWTDSKPLPALDASNDAAWDCYVRNWRPGHPRRETWDAFRAQALGQVAG